MVITGGTRPARPRPADAKQQGSWLQRNVTGPLYEQLAAGVTPNSLARSVAMGLTVGVGPLPMLSGIIVGLLSVACGFNMVAGQVAQLVMAPVQLALIVPFMRLGEWMTGWEPTSLEDITRFTEGDILGSLGSVWQGFACALLPWLLIAPFLFALARAITQPIFTRIVAQDDKLT